MAISISTCMGLGPPWFSHREVASFSKAHCSPVSLRPSRSSAVAGLERRRMVLMRETISEVVCSMIQSMDLGV